MKFESLDSHVPSQNQSPIYSGYSWEPWPQMFPLEPLSNKQIVPTTTRKAHFSLSDVSPSLSLRIYLDRPSMSLRLSSTRNVRMTTWRPSMGTVTQQPSWVDCVAVRSRSSWSPPATRCTSASFLMHRYNGRASKLHTPQVCVCMEAYIVSLCIWYKIWLYV